MDLNLNACIYLVTCLLQSLSSLIEDHLAEVVMSTIVLNDLIAECFKRHSNALLLRRCRVVVSIRLVFD